MDKRVLRLIQKWVSVGVIEDGAWTASDVGAPQGASVSPFANIYLHYVFDRWARQWRRRNAGGDMIIVRFADDFVAGFEHQADAQRFLADLRQRFAKFGLELHPDKTRLIEFGRFKVSRAVSDGGQSRRRRRPSTARSSRSTKTTRDPKTIRGWATDHGISVPARGRIPGDVERRYNEANGRS